MREWEDEGLRADRSPQSGREEGQAVTGTTLAHWFSNLSQAKPAEHRLTAAWPQKEREYVRERKSDRERIWLTIWGLKGHAQPLQGFHARVNQMSCFVTLTLEGSVDGISGSWNDHSFYLSSTRITTAVEKNLLAALWLFSWLMSHATGSFLSCFCYILH